MTSRNEATLAKLSEETSVTTSKLESERYRAAASAYELLASIHLVVKTNETREDKADETLIKLRKIYADGRRATVVGRKEIEIRLAKLVSMKEVGDEIDAIRKKVLKLVTSVTKAGVRSFAKDALTRRRDVEMELPKEREKMLDRNLTVVEKAFIGSKEEKASVDGLVVTLRKRLWHW